MIQSYIPSRDKRFISSPKCPELLWDLHSLQAICTWGTYLWDKEAAAIPSLPLYVLTA